MIRADKTAGLFTNISPPPSQDNHVELSLECRHVAWDAAIIAADCCTQAYRISKGLSGQLFDEAHFNVCIAYANCNHGIDDDRPSEFPEDSHGINGDCQDNDGWTLRGARATKWIETFPGPGIPTKMWSNRLVGGDPNVT